MESLKNLLNYIQPSDLTYQEWINVGMALKQEGYTASDWEEWSSSDPRHKNGECFMKWNTFNGTGCAPVTGGTIFEYAKRGGFVPSGSDPSDPGHALGWDDTIVKDDLKIVDSGWLEEKEVHEPSDASWDPVQDLITYLETLFQSTENVGYVTDVYETEGRLSPKKGNWDRTAGELIEELRKCGGDIGKVIGDPNPAAGAWIRFNPLDGKGIKNDNVTDFRYALVESDSLSLGKQNAIIRELEIPVACLVYSGGKSVHAIVRIDASDYQEYRKRVEYLYKVCEKNGLVVDTQNKNPSRLSRMPGIKRNGHKQFLMATNIGKASWTEWSEWIEGINDNLPDMEDLSTVWDNLPPLADCLIEGVLRKGHKMLLVGPSKSGKSFALIELAIAIAEGRPWLGFPCSMGKVLYVNLELDRASCLHRFKDVYDALEMRPENIRNIDIWNLRGMSVPMDKLAPKLIRRAEKKNYMAVIIDPIYKVITGDENSADQMAAFCNQFDKICTELKCAVIYCHHHSKGAQGGKKSMDRASGSGVFARDPDALLDLTELEVTPELMKMLEGKAEIHAIETVLTKYHPGWEKDVSLDGRLSPATMRDYAANKLNTHFESESALIEEKSKEFERLHAMKAIRLEGTLREFHGFEALNVWFDYPVHRVDDIGVLKDIAVDDGDAKAKKQREWVQQQKEKAAETWEAYDVALKELFDDGTTEISYKDLAELLAKDPDTVRRDLTGAKDKKGRFSPRYSQKIKEAGFKYVKGRIFKVDSKADSEKK